MSSVFGIEGDGYSAFDEAGSTAISDSATHAIQSKTATASISLADVNLENRHKPLQNYSRDEFLYALSSPSSVGAIAWIATSFMAAIYGSSIVVYLNFAIALLLGPYTIKEQMPAQLLPSVQRKFDKLLTEGNALAVKNVRLKASVSRMQRQEYRLSATEERFEHLCKRSNKDIVEMKQLARKNAALRQKIKVHLTGKKLQAVLTNMLTVDQNGNYCVGEKQMEEVVSLMKVYAGKDTFKFDKDVIRRAVITSMAKNMKTTFIPDAESDTETRDSEVNYDERKMQNSKEAERMYGLNEEGTLETYTKMDIIARPSLESNEQKPDFDTLGEESWAMSKNREKKLDPSGLQHDDRHYKEAYRGMMPTSTASVRSGSVRSGTEDKPIDIEKLLFQSKKKTMLPTYE